jgi:hypothetical protein
MLKVLPIYFGKTGGNEVLKQRINEHYYSHETWKRYKDNRVFRYKKKVIQNQEKMK